MFRLAMIVETVIKKIRRRKAWVPDHTRAGAESEAVTLGQSCMGEGWRSGQRSGLGRAVCGSA
jgi:hypothetical protein